MNRVAQKRINNSKNNNLSENSITLNNNVDESFKNLLLMETFKIFLI